MLKLLLSVVLGSGDAIAASETPLLINSPQELMQVAIDAPDGSAQGILTGELASAIGRQFHTTAPLQVQVTTLKRYSQPGCRRLNVAIIQDAVVIPGNSTPENKRIDFGIDYCRDGSPPRSKREE
ncbi:hypothetical protein GJ700_02470 [Duganella sp. FT92W]|uniref:DUF3617 family protein n=1 Tax=Pseudoduganella rivuli TaxID=2666085 RepID=A0A7X2IJD6_9BURK|nr:hypothetical protein [Pseudoduganella rivuli]MRV70583.1 hypothetical protein [Pseudoduganella rivuli]